MVSNVGFWMDLGMKCGWGRKCGWFKSSNAEFVLKSFECIFITADPRIKMMRRMLEKHELSMCGGLKKNLHFRAYTTIFHLALGWDEGICGEEMR
jgi:hypothetical protein